MKNLKFPGYLYKGSTQIGVYNFNMVMDTAFVNSFSSQTANTWVTLQDIQDISVENAAEVINKYFKHNIFNSSNHLAVGLESGEVLPSWWNTATARMNLHTDTYVMTRADHQSPYTGQRLHLMNSCVGTHPSIGFAGYVKYAGNPETSSVVYASLPLYAGSVYVAYDSHYGEFYAQVFREDVFKADGTLATSGSAKNHIEIRALLSFNNSFTKVTRIRIGVRYVTSISEIENEFTPVLNKNGAQTTESDPDDPFQNGGGDGNDGGDGEFPPATNETVDVPDLPSASAASCGLITMYTPTLGQLRSLGQFLWSNLFDIDSFKKLFSDPMQAIVGLAIVPAVPSSGGSKNIHFGNVDSGVSSSYITTQYVKKSFGSVKIKKDVGSFLDFTDTKISIYLPYLGFRSLSPDDVMGATLTVTYNIDVLTGACAAFIKSSARGVMYAYNGSCITNVPVTGQNFSGAIQNAVSTVASGAGVIAGMASGAAPVTAMSMTAMLTSAANTALNSKPDIQRSGNLGGSAGILSVQKPFVIIQRPNLDVPDNLNHFVGNVTFKSMTLGSCSGFTMVDQVHLDGFAATSAEKSEIESLLKGGVIL